MVEVKSFVIGPIETNCYVVYDTITKTGFLIDPGFFDEDVRSFIKKNNITIKNIIDTHGHSDHILANGKFAYPILIHKDDNSFLRNPMKNLSILSGNILISPKAERLLEDGDVIEGGDIKLEVIHTPGHTPGSISLKTEDKIFTGDTLFFEGVGRTDLPGGDGKKILDSIKKRLMVFDDNIKIFPGHGPSSTIEHERKNNPFL